MNLLHFMGRGPYLSPGNCIGILCQKMKCIRILDHKWIHMDSDQIGFTDSFNFGKKCIHIPIFLMYSYSAVQELQGFGSGEISTSAKILHIIPFISMHLR